MTQSFADVHGAIERVRSYLDGRDALALSDGDFIHRVSSINHASLTVSDLRTILAMFDQLFREGL